MVMLAACCLRISAAACNLRLIEHHAVQFGMGCKQGLAITNVQIAASSSALALSSASSWHDETGHISGKSL